MGGESGGGALRAIGLNLIARSRSLLSRRCRWLRGARRSGVCVTRRDRAAGWGGWRMGTRSILVERSIHERLDSAE